MDYAHALQRYTVAFESLTRQNLRSDLGPLLDENVYFKDPFNTLKGKQATLHMFEHMFDSLKTPFFKVRHQALDRDTALIEWEFFFAMKQGEPLRRIEGMSRVTFSAKGLVDEHVDFWDAGEQVYAQIPLLRWGIKQVKRRLAAPKPG